ncbi:MAG: Wzz/FepE/Etk N-terminal domain-containing protein, partial [Parvularcula sp.]|nr:Wzz/FepE/Etk N-terminal domain-containing protein [Parvularcula sp.]
MNRVENTFASSSLEDPRSFEPRSVTDRTNDDDAFHLDLERYWLEAQIVRVWLGVILVGCLLAALIITLLMQPIYRAEARIEVSQIAANVTDLDPLDGGSTVSELQYLNTQYELLESRFMASRVVEAGNLARDPQFLEAFDLTDAEDLTTRKIEDLVADQVSIQGITQSSLVDIVISSPSPEVSANLANLWAEEFIAANYDKRFGDNIEARDFLQSQLGELRETLARSERELVEYANANEILVLEAGDGEGAERTAAQTLAA